MPSDTSLDINVDLIFVIDITGSMSHTIKTVKDTVLGLYDRLRTDLAEKGRDIQELRVKVIGFRDFEFDGERALEESEFFSLPQQEGLLHEFVGNLVAEGGGDIPETAVDAISVAMKQDWVKTGTKRRHIIMAFTDAPTKMPGKSGRDDLPKDLDAFINAWNDENGPMDPKAKRLVVVAPNDESWSFLDELDLAVWEQADPNDLGLSDMSMETVMALLINSI